jgi:hypothetical protein
LGSLGKKVAEINATVVLGVEIVALEIYNSDATGGV